jgi:hypothetical protein
VLTNKTGCAIIQSEREIREITKMKNEKSYIYFAVSANIDKRIFKIGESSNLENRANTLWTQNRVKIARYVKFNGTKDERLFIESYLRVKYSANCNLAHFGNDHFKARNGNSLKGAENKFFVNVAEAFAMLETIKNKSFSYKVYTGKFDKWAEWMDELD